MRHLRLVKERESNSSKEFRVEDLNERLARLEEYSKLLERRMDERERKIEEGRGRTVLNLYVDFKLNILAAICLVHLILAQFPWL
jgi:hypothetical protein